MGLTPKQEIYCQARTEGLSQRRAYRRAYPRSKSWKDGSVDREACVLEASPKISQRLGELRAATAEKTVLTRSKLLERLDSLADKSEKVVSAKYESQGRIDYNASQALVSATKELLPFAVQESEERPEFVRDFGLLLAPSFLEPHRIIADGSQTDIWLGGGRGSMKSSCASLEVVNHIERNPDQHALVLMKHKVNIRDSVYAQIVWAIRMLGLEDDYEMPESTLRIRKISTGQLILFRGCDNPKKVKSVKIPFGYIGIAWYEEADMFNGMSEIRSVNQSLTRGGAEFVRLYTFNPPRSLTCWINRHVAGLRAKGVPVFESTYLQAPREWLGDQFFEDAEALREEDELAYRHEYLGEPVGNGANVFDRIVLREVTDEEIDSFDNIRCGQDFGWYPDPWAFTMSDWQPGRRRIVTWYEDGGNKLTPPKQAERIKAALTWRDSPDSDPVLHPEPVYSDDADPQSISQQRDAGANARAAGKANMRRGSYRFLQSVEWVIDPVRCPKLAAEVTSMEYERNREGEVLNTIPDGNDHYVDSVRYAFMREARSRYAYRSATPSVE